MDFSKKLKELRKQSGLSQEQLADKLNVSRQAITKWETGGGMPDIENLVAIAKLFGATLDELLGDGGAAALAADFFYESITEYDISAKKRFDIHIGGAKAITLSVAGNEKARLHLASNTIKSLETSFKVKLDEHDIDIKRAADITEAEAKESLHVFISLPKRFLAHTELEAVAETLNIIGFRGETLEFDGKVSRVAVNSSSANIEVNSMTDLEIEYDAFSGRLELNLMSATAKLNIPGGAAYSVAKKGRSNSISFLSDDRPCVKETANDAENSILLKGFHSELIINELSAGKGRGHE